MKIIYLLSGPGIKEGYSNEIKKEIKKDINNAKTITFIASSPSDHAKTIKYIYGNDEIVGIINHLKEIHEFKEINVIDDLNIDKNKIMNSDVVYLLGGDHDSQLEFILKNNLQIILKKYNGVLLCTSCGAMNVAKYGYYSKDKYYTQSFFYKGINLVDTTIDPHFDINDSEQVNEAIRMSKTHKIYGVPNDSCIKISNNILKLIGNVYIYEDGLFKGNE